MTSTDTATAETPIADAAAADAAVENPTPASTPEERAKQFQAFMAKVMGDLSRTRLQIDYTARHFHGEIVELHGRIDHIEGVLGMICEALHIEMPKRQPKLIDAKVDLTAELNEGEVCELRAAWSATKHPIFGHYQLILGGADDAQAANSSQFHPLVMQRIDEAFTALRQSADFVDGQFYYVRLGLIHAQPISEASVPLNTGAVAEAEAPAANDDTAPAVETADVQSE